MDRNDYHRAADLADKVLRKNNGFLDGLPQEDVRPDGYLPDIRNWVTLRGWRLTENAQMGTEGNGWPRKYASDSCVMPSPVWRDSC